MLLELDMTDSQCLLDQCFRVVGWAVKRDIVREESSLADVA